jgi:hypothetical protein
MEGVVFNRSKVKARDKVNLLKSVSKDAPVEVQLNWMAQRYEYLAEFFSRVVAECPPEWGDPTNPDTYLNLNDDVFGEIWTSYNAKESADAKN